MNRTSDPSKRGRHDIGLLVRAMLAVALAAVPIAGHAADAEPYPSRPIRLIVPFTAGNQLDVFARLIGARLSESVGQPVLIENRQGVAGNAASEAVAKAAPDGYTLLVSGVLVTLLPLTYGSRAVDPVVSFAPVTRIAQGPLVLAVNPSLNVNSLTELIALARTKPGKLAYATSGIGTLQHIAMTMLSERAGVEFLHVPYANTGQMVGDVLGGQVPIVVSFPGDDRTARQGRTSESTRGHGRAARAGMAGYADGSRIRVPRLRSGVVDRHPGAGGNAAGNCRPAA